jgi:acyl-coenzyme A synthetase/AMP-(fatty) acid ligase
VKLPPDYMQVPARLNLAERVLRAPAERPALYFEEQTVTYGELDALSNRYGNALSALGLARGDRFCLRAPNSIDYVAALLGGIKIGAVGIPSSTLFRTWELEHLLENSDVKVVLVSDDLRRPLDELDPGCDIVPLAGLAEGESDELEPVQLDAKEPAFTIYTSGTTGKPKGVEHAHRWIVGAGDPAVHAHMQLRPEDVCFQPQDLSFIMALGCCVLFPLYAGAQGVLWAGRFDLDRALRMVERARVTHFVAVPTLYRMLLAVPDLERRYDLSSIRMGLSGGEPMPEDTYREVKRRFGFEVHEMIGQTELHMYCTIRPGMEAKPGSLGQPLPGHRCTILDEEGNDLPPGEVGHLCIAADDPGLALGYRKQEDVWRAMFRHGWFHTGDLAYRDEDGYYWFVSRADDLIKSRAYLISPAEVEAATMEHPAVLESAVVGVADELLGQRVAAFVVLKPGHEASDELAQEIRERVGSLIAPYKVPKDIGFVPELPKTATGKIQRKLLRERAPEVIRT